jgi:hypothetical protein
MFAVVVLPTMKPASSSSVLACVKTVARREPRYAAMPPLPSGGIAPPPLHSGRIVSAQATEVSIGSSFAGFPVQVGRARKSTT